ncbi:DUF4169 family protein [Shimia sp.]|uniref:DUF4169 family protein n=1 Tax=Shimia sp. TaxID=1954381 RepID=UPI0032988464
MSEPVNLNRFRKQKTRAAKKARADQNAVKFGRTKAEKDSTSHAADKAADHVDKHKLDE